MYQMLYSAENTQIKKDLTYLWDSTSEAACNDDKKHNAKEPERTGREASGTGEVSTKEGTFELCLKG